MVGVVKYFHLLGVLSALIFMLWGCCPMVLLSILSFLCPPTWPHDENVDCPHLYHVLTWPEMGSYTLMVGVVKYFHLLGVLSTLIFILWIYYHMVLFYNFSFLCPPTSLHEANIDCPHLYHVITLPEIWSYTLMVGIVKYFHLLGILSALIFILWGCCPMVLLSIISFLCLPTWPHDENVDRPQLYHVITWPEMGSYTLMVGVVKYFHLLGVLSALIFILWGCCPMVLLSILALLCPPTWPAWWECWSSTPVSCDDMTRDGIVHLDGWSSKIFSSFGCFVRLDFLCFGAVVIWCFYPFFLFSVRPCDRMMRMLIVHTCIMWSHDQRWDRTPWWLQ